jgi:hypothetical protein
MDDLYFKFTVPFEDSEKLGTATIEAYNLSPATRNSIKKGMPIILNAGYEGDIGAIFTGKVSQVSDNIAAQRSLPPLRPLKLWKNGSRKRSTRPTPPGARPVPL